MRIGDKVVYLPEGCLGEVIEIEEGSALTPEYPIITAKTLIGNMSGRRLSFQYANVSPELG